MLFVGLSVNKNISFSIWYFQAYQTNCSFPDFFCNPTADDLLYKVEETVNTAEECNDICKKDKNCKFFTFFNIRRSPSCFALKGCQEKLSGCTVASNCVSGGENCNNAELAAVCPKLRLKKGDKARWRCKGINPYSQDIPGGTHCYAT